MPDWPSVNLIVYSEKYGAHDASIDLEVLGSAITLFLTTTVPTVKYELATGVVSLEVLT